MVTPLEARLLVADLARGFDQTDRLALGPIRRINVALRGQDQGDLSDFPTTRPWDLRA
jgi:hypothetical protein